MNKKILLILISTLFCSLPTLACDVCGCNLSGLYFGFVPLQNSHFIGIKYSQTTFKSYIDNNDYYGEDEYSNDMYQKFDLVGRFSFGKRFQVRYVLPYMINDMNGSHQNVHTSGIGDPMIIGYYSLINTGHALARNFKHSLIVGSGLKLPVSQHNKLDNGKIINRNFQLSSGSIDYLLSTNYTIRFKKIGINVEASYKINSKNKDGYRFGNQYNMSENIFYYMEMKKVSIIPFVGTYFEKADFHKNGKIIEANTGGSGLFGCFGTQIFTDKFTINMQYQIPIRQNFNTDSFAQIQGGNRVSLGLYYSFSFNKKMIQSMPK